MALVHSTPAAAISYCHASRAMPSSVTSTTRPASGILRTVAAAALRIPRHKRCCLQLVRSGGSAEGGTGDSSTGPIAWIKRAFGGGGKVDKAKLAEYGLGAFAAYGILSNLNAGVLVTLAWLAVVKQTGQTPVDPGNWPIFLGIYAGLYLTTNLLRPVRLTLALTAAPFFNAGLDRIMALLRVNKAVAFGIMLAGIAITSFTGILSAIIVCGGFPNGVPQLPWKR